MHRLDKAQIVGNTGCARQQFAKPRSRFTVLPEFKFRRCNWESRLPAVHGREPLTVADIFRQILIEVILHQRFVIEEILLSRRTGLERVDHKLRCDVLIGKTRHTGSVSAVSGSGFANSDVKSIEPSVSPDCFKNVRPAKPVFTSLRHQLRMESDRKRQLATTMLGA